MSVLDVVNNPIYRFDCGLTESVDICPRDIAEVNRPAHLERNML
jgi:hypothetical protein